MSSPTVLLNNLVQEEDDIHIDALSKTYLIGEVVLGLNRLIIFDKIKPILISLASAYSLICCGAVFYTSFINDPVFPYHIDFAIDAVHYILGIVLSSIVWKRLQNYYKKLKEFDMDVGRRPKMSSSSVKNLIQMCIAVSLILLTVPYEWYVVDSHINPFTQLPVRLLHIIDIHFYGHLLSLLIPRLRLINYYMKMSLNNNKEVVPPKGDDLKIKSSILESQNCQMKKLMGLYCMIISAYDILIDAIKWQFVMVLTSMFISMLSFSYNTALYVINGLLGYRVFFNVAVESAFHCIRLSPLFAPCVFADQIQEEVRRLRELLASRLYENKLSDMFTTLREFFLTLRPYRARNPTIFIIMLNMFHKSYNLDKSGRGVARALLALTEARDLSFSLLQIFDIDISLPFKFLGLLLTYLIILLQFEKVINPKH